MSRVKQSVDNSFWKRLYVLSKLVEPKTAGKLAVEFGVEEEQIKADIYKATEFGLEMKYEEIGEDFWIIPSPSEQENVGINLSVFEWAI